MAHISTKVCAGTAGASVHRHRCRTSPPFACVLLYQLTFLCSLSNLSQVYVRPAAAGRRTVGGSAAADAAAGELGDGSADGDDLGFGTPSGAGPMGGQRGVYKFYFNIGSVDAFEHAMEEAQEALGVPAARSVCGMGGRSGGRCCLRLTLMCKRLHLQVAANSTQLLH